MHKFAMITLIFLLGMSLSIVWAEDEPITIEPAMIVTVDNPIVLSATPDSVPKTQWCPNEECILFVESSTVFHLLDIATGQQVKVDLSASKPGDMPLRYVEINSDATEFLVAWPKVSNELWNIQGERLLSIETDASFPYALWNEDESLLLVDKQSLDEANMKLVFDAKAYTQIQAFQADYGSWFGDRDEIITYSHYASSVFLWNAHTGAQLDEFITTGNLEYVWPDKTQTRIFAYTQQGEVYIWNVNDRSLDRKFSYGNEIYFPMGDNEAGKLVFNGRNNRNVMVWDITTGALPFTFVHPDVKAPTALDISPSGDLLAVESADSVLLVNINTGETSHEFSYSGSAVSSWSPDGSKILIPSSDDYLCEEDCETRVDVRDVKTGEQLLNTTYVGPLHRRNAMWIWDSTHIITFAENTMSIWNVSEGIERYRMNHGDSIEFIDDMLVSPGQNWVFTVVDNTLFVWDLSDLSSR